MLAFPRRDTILLNVGRIRRQFEIACALLVLLDKAQPDEIERRWAALTQIKLFGDWNLVGQVA